MFHSNRKRGRDEDNDVDDAISMDLAGKLVIKEDEDEDEQGKETIRISRSAPCHDARASDRRYRSKNRMTTRYKCELSTTKQTAGDKTVK